MKIDRYCLFLILLVISVCGRAEQPNIDSLRTEIQNARNDTLKLVLLSIMSEAYAEISPDSSYYYGNQLAILSRTLKFRLNEAEGELRMGYALLNMVNYPRSLQAFLSALAVAEDPASERNVLPWKYLKQTPFNEANMPRLNVLTEIHHLLGILYGNANNYSKDIYHEMQALRITEQTGNLPYMSLIYSAMGRVYLATNRQDSALYCGKKAYELAVQSGYKKYLGTILFNLGRTYLAQGDRVMAIKHMKAALTASIEQGYYRGVVAGNLLLSDLYRQSDYPDSSLYFARKGLAMANQVNTPDLLRRSYEALTTFYKAAGESDSTVKYQELVIEMNGQIFNSKQAQQFENIDFDAKQRQQEIRDAEAAVQNRLQKYLLLAGLVVVLLVAIFLWRISRHRQKLNTILERQKKEIETALSDLKSTQAQLIQSEKMASLGELTAGIAHEIQNPLNFVNNFSEVNKELIDELREERKKDNRNFKSEDEILNSIKENEEKITFHGKRADSIVKGMLKHSRSSSAVKQPTDINMLADEYFRLAYHGLRAKDKSFNVTMKSDYDESIGDINVVPQDIGRVILNLITNAFYAASEKKADKAGVADDNAYEPTVNVTTRKAKGKVTIEVRDNGNGIPKVALDKIFQPFFTTKPPGQGTGLGLSMSFDIVKWHGGDLKVETRDGEGAAFTIELPLL
jgi:two-component system, NtrC family, sensor kinase